LQSIADQSSLGVRSSLPVVEPSRFPLASPSRSAAFDDSLSQNRALQAPPSRQSQTSQTQPPSQTPALPQQASPSPPSPPSSPDPTPSHQRLRKKIASDQSSEEDGDDEDETAGNEDKMSVDRGRTRQRGDDANEGDAVMEEAISMSSEEPPVRDCHLFFIFLSF
jgi:hypothetical protein